MFIHFIYSPPFLLRLKVAHTIKIVSISAIHTTDNTIMCHTTLLQIAWQLENRMTLPLPFRDLAQGALFAVPAVKSAELE